MSSTTTKTPIKFARRTSSGRLVSLSRDDDIDMGLSGELTSTSSDGPNDYMNYTVHMPPTPDNQPYAAHSGSKPDGVATKRGNRRGGGSGGGGVEEGDYGGGGGGGGGGEGDAAAKMDRRMSVMNSNKSMLMRVQTGDFDHNRWLFETKGTYGMGNAFWPKDDMAYDEEEEPMTMSDFLEKPWKPLTRKVQVPPSILSPYRY